MKPEKILYSTQVTATGGRDGRAVSRDGRLAVSLVMPKEFGGPGVGGTDPEQLFGAACFLTALKHLGRLKKTTIPDDATVTATIGVGEAENGYVLTAELKIALPGIPPATAQELVAAAHEECPFSRAMRGNIDVVLTVVEA